MTPEIAVCNESTVMEDAEVQRIVGALQIQISRDFATAWGIDANLTFFARGARPPPVSWVLAILDDSDQAGDLGYHCTTGAGNPLGKVFAQTDLDHGLSVSVTASHETLEILGDPEANQVVATPDGTEYARELCDPCEDDQFGYLINGVRVSDFVLPAYFAGTSLLAAGETRFSFTGALRGPIPELLTGGYLSVLPRGASGWQQVFGERSAASRAHDRWFHRRRLRATPAAQRRRSTRGA